MGSTREILIAVIVLLVVNAVACAVQVAAMYYTIGIHIQPEEVGTPLMIFLVTGSLSIVLARLPHTKG